MRTTKGDGDAAPAAGDDLKLTMDLRPRTSRMSPAQKPAQYDYPGEE
ncbi:MAG: hypothetical protein GY910_19710 [bacterium]|nr:hypothetical protein [bacterium]